MFSPDMPDDSPSVIGAHLAPLPTQHEAETAWRDLFAARLVEPVIIHVPAPLKPGQRDSDLFLMLRGFSDTWFVIEGKGGPGSQYKLKHSLWAYMHELGDKRDAA